MSIKVSKSFSGHCPLQNDHETIRVDFGVINTAGSLVPGYKKVGFLCDYGAENDCDYDANCPIYLSATRP